MRVNFFLNWALFSNYPFNTMTMFFVIIPRQYLILLHPNPDSATAAAKQKIESVCESAKLASGSKHVGIRR